MADEQRDGVRDPLVGNGNGKWCTKRRVAIISIATAVVGGLILIGVFVHPNKNAECREIIQPPNHGTMKCGKSPPFYKCQFFCSEGYGIRDKNPITCRYGKWKDPPPSCEKMCQPPLIPDNGQVNSECRGHAGWFEDSKCNFWCLNNHKLEGVEEITCQDNGKWSHDSPACICPECMTGVECRDTKSWKNVSETLKNQDYSDGNVVQVHYATKVFYCNSITYKPPNWEGACADGNETVASCTKSTAADAATQAAATLIRKKMNDTDNQYEEPCDEKDMPPICNS